MREIVKRRDLSLGFGVSRGDVSGGGHGRACVGRR
jgi:hypothetical protein